jgi:putative endonuclease
MKSGPWAVYILECKDGSFYTGSTSDIDNRMRLHAEGKGSKYVFRKGFKKLLATKNFKNRSEACKAEYQIKQLPKWEKINWFKN